MKNNKNIVNVRENAENASGHPLSINDSFCRKWNRNWFLNDGWMAQPKQKHNDKNKDNNSDTEEEKKN